MSNIITVDTEIGVSIITKGGKTIVKPNNYRFEVGDIVTSSVNGKKRIDRIEEINREIGYFNSTYTYIENLFKFELIPTPSKLRNTPLCDACPATIDDRKTFESSGKSSGLWLIEGEWLKLEEGEIYDVTNKCGYLSTCVYTGTDSSYIKTPIFISTKGVFTFSDSYVIYLKDIEKIEKVSIENSNRLQNFMSEYGIVWDLKMDCIRKLTWTPQEGQVFYYIDSDMLVKRKVYVSSEDESKVTAFNTFKDEPRADKILSKIKNIIMDPGC